MDWNANKCPANFCHAFKMLQGHQSINCKHAPFLVHRQPPVTQMSSLGLWFMEADLQAASSCSNLRLDVFLPCTSSQLSWRPACRVDAIGTSIQTEPMPGAAGHFTGYRQDQAQVPSATSLLPASPFCAIPTQGVSRKICSLFPRSDGSYYFFHLLWASSTQKTNSYFLDAIHISFPSLTEAQTANQKRILSPFSIAIRTYSPHGHSEDQISKLITFSTGTMKKKITYLIQEQESSYQPYSK